MGQQDTPNGRAPSTGSTGDRSGHPSSSLNPERTKAQSAEPPADARRLVTAPRIRHGAVVRPRITRTLQGAAGVPLVTLTAPAGFGKTTAVVHWRTLAGDTRPTAWLTLREAVDDPGLLATWIEESLLRAGAVEHLPDPQGRTAVDRLAAHVTRAAPFVLVVSNAHHLGVAAQKLLVGLSRELTEGAQFVVSTRTKIDVPLGFDRATGSAARIGPDDLALTVDEAELVFAAEGVACDRADVAGLVERCEGWPAAVYLATRAAAARAGAVRDFDGTQTDMLDYLEQEVLGAIEDEERVLLACTAVLTEISSALCDAILETTGSEEVVRELDRAGLLVPVDDHRVWYRHRRLLHDVLLTEVECKAPRTAIAVRARAAAWYAEHERPSDAIEYALSADPLEEAPRIIRASWIGCLAHGRAGDVLHWIDRLPDSVVAHDAWLQTAKSWCLVLAGDGVGARECADSARQLVDRKTPARPAIQAAADLQRALFWANGMTEMLDAARRAELAAPIDCDFRSLTIAAAATALVLARRTDEATPRLHAAEALEDATHDAAAAMAGCCRAAIAALAGRWDETVELAVAARRLPAAHLPGAALHCALDSALARALAQTGRLSDAEVAADAALGILGEGPAFPPWLGIQIRAMLAPALDILGRDAEAGRMRADGRSLMSGLADAGVFGDQLDSGCGDPAAAGDPEALTAAEQRILRMLATRLSQGEIAAELCLSPNTVKTHRRTIYRKLGVASRSAAVELARSLHLL